MRDSPSRKASPQADVAVKIEADESVKVEADVAVKVEAQDVPDGTMASKYPIFDTTTFPLSNKVLICVRTACSAKASY